MSGSEITSIGASFIFTTGNAKVSDTFLIMDLYQSVRLIGHPHLRTGLCVILKKMAIITVIMNNHSLDSSSLQAASLQTDFFAIYYN